MFERVFVIIRHSCTIALSEHQAHEQEMRVQMGEGSQKARLSWPVLPACSAPSSGGFQRDLKNEKAQCGPKPKEGLATIPVQDTQPVFILCGLCTF